MGMNVEHIALFVLAAFLLYHLTRSCGCANSVDGFNVGGVTGSLYVNCEPITNSKHSQCNIVNYSHGPGSIECEGENCDVAMDECKETCN